MNVRHDAQIEVTTTPKYGPFRGRTDVVRADMLDSHFTVMSAIYVGNSLTKHGAASISIKVLSGELAEGELCTCDKCESGFYD